MVGVASFVSSVAPPSMITAGLVKTPPTWRLWVAVPVLPAASVIEATTA